MPGQLSWVVGSRPARRKSLTRSGEHSKRLLGKSFVTPLWLNFRSNVVIELHAAGLNPRAVSRACDNKSGGKFVTVWPSKYVQWFGTVFSIRKFAVAAINSLASF